MVEQTLPNNGYGLNSKITDSFVFLPASLKNHPKYYRFALSVEIESTVKIRQSSSCGPIINMNNTAVTVNFILFLLYLVENLFFGKVFKELVAVLLQIYHQFGCNISLNVHFLHSHLDFSLVVELLVTSTEKGPINERSNVCGLLPVCVQAYSKIHKRKSKRQRYQEATN